jgi:hypothetical protein
MTADLAIPENYIRRCPNCGMRSGRPAEHGNLITAEKVRNAAALRHREPAPAGSSGLHTAVSDGLPGAE